MNLLDGFSDATVLVVPGLRDHVAEHWQTQLVAALRAQGRAVHSVPTMGRDDLDCAARVAAIEREAQTWPAPERSRLCPWRARSGCSHLWR
ncbi:MAG: hypothetical protein E6H58_00685 [Betaproteobacteria bacterium]|nr:MAG: hypothetical protein E6H65_17690 [Betaproteobacteria bacterium]TMH36933.1 MAG: hypothetical protein E6H58_00685 [Betaproteobacteria bacterium]